MFSPFFLLSFLSALSINRGSSHDGSLILIANQLRFNTPYQIRVEPDTDDKAAPYSVGVNPTLSGYVSEALLWAGPRQPATLVEFSTPTLIKDDTREISDEDAFMLLLYGKEKNMLGFASRYRPLEDQSDEDEDDNDDSKKAAYRLGTDVEFGGYSPVNSRFYLTYV